MNSLHLFVQNQKLKELDFHFYKFQIYTLVMDYFFFGHLDILNLNLINKQINQN